ncbi:MAG TPA: hypothetical protein H9909_10365 [Candidatus Mediterraneibacter norfolkensis]|nr:hypothetical protein [Candidatus Mediterraneibacter norfolkensis]
MKHRREAKYHLITANFEKYDFNQLFDEENSNDKKIIWKIGGKDGVGAQNYNVGDKCYIYYANLPDGTNRILLCGTVTESDTDRDNAVNEKFSYNESERIKGMWLGNIRAVALNAPEKFNADTLYKVYGKSNIQGQQYLDTPGEMKLVEDLDKCPDKKNLRAVRNYFQHYTKCFFSGKTKYKHITFTSDRGINFYEKHHLILDSYLKDIGAEKLRKDCHILINLCPVCHKQMHHGRAEDVRELVHLMYEANAEWCNENLKEYAENDGFSDVEKWILHTYDSQRKHNKYELLLK